MSTSVVSITRRELPWQTLSSEIVIGKDILELLSSSMYIDPMSIFREYVQNAADAIDEARATGQIKWDQVGRVRISVDPAARGVTIRDNGAGIAQEDFVERLTAFGASRKRGQGARGFRGVGRLAGIGYCQELVFRSQTPEDDKVSELRWDCRKLKAILRSSEGFTDLSSAVAQIVEFRRITATHQSEHFFEVEMRGIVRHRNDQLLSAAAISSYLGQTGPVPFREDFPFRDAILAHIESHVRLGDLEILVAEQDGPVRRPHGAALEVGDGVYDAFTEAELLTIKGIDGGTAGLGWVLHHGYTGALPTSCNVRGLRVRCGNIQVGDDRLFEELFPEARFNSWSVGELHVVDPRIIPNGRRDHFEQTVHFHNLLTHMTPVARQIAARCRTSSVQRKWSREFDLREASIREKAAIATQGAIGSRGRSGVIEEIKTGVAYLHEITLKGDLPGHKVAELKKRTSTLERYLDRTLKAPVKARSLSGLPSGKRRIYERVIGLIYECSSSQANAKLLVDRILARIG